MSVLLTVGVLSVPPVVVTSDAAKPVGASLNVKVMVAVWPAFRAETLLVIARVGWATTVVVATAAEFSKKPASS